MASIIQEAIPKQPFELIRDMLVLILRDEVLNQATIQGDSYLSGTSVFTEKWVPFTKQNLPAINVMVQRNDGSNKSAVSFRGEYKYMIDCFVSAPSTQVKKAETEAAERLHRLVGWVQFILNHHQYRNLGFDTPVVETSVVSEILFSEPEDTKDAQSILIGRLIFEVSTPSGIQAIAGQLLNEVSTQVKLSETEEGFIYSGENIPEPAPPECDPSEIRTVGGLVIDLAPSGRFFVVPNTQISNSDDSFTDEVEAAQPYGLQDTEVKVFLNGSLEASIVQPTFKED